VREGALRDRRRGETAEGESDGERSRGERRTERRFKVGEGRAGRRWTRRRRKKKKGGPARPRG